MDLSFIVSIFQRIIQESSPVTNQIISCLNSSCCVENGSCLEFKPFADLSCVCVFLKCLKHMAVRGNDIFLLQFQWAGDTCFKILMQFEMKSPFVK